MADRREQLYSSQEHMNISDPTLDTFLEWCKLNNLTLSDKVAVGVKGSCHRYGMVATEDIDTDESLFEIPRSLLLEPKSSGISKILTEKVKTKSIDSHEGSSWVPLLMALMYEYTNPKSFWRPYLDIAPGVDVLDQPMFWQMEDRLRLLKGVGIDEDVEGDLTRIGEQYQNVALPLIQKFKKHFSKKNHSLSLYKHMAAFIMAYSFTEDSPGYHGDNTPVMVPMADILNHHSNNNARLEFGEEVLTMVSTQPIAKGQEVFNTYGQLANCHLLQSYGFVESTPNPNDTVEAPLDLFCKIVRGRASTKREARIVDAKFQFMEEMGLISGNDVIVFGRDGSYLEGPDLQLFLKILHLGEDLLRKLLQQSGEEDCEELSDVSELLNNCSDEQKDSSLQQLHSVLKTKGSTRPRETPSQKTDLTARKRNRNSNRTEVLENKRRKSGCSDLNTPELSRTECCATSNQDTRDKALYKKVLEDCSTDDAATERISKDQSSSSYPEEEGDGGDCCIDNDDDDDDDGSDHSVDDNDEVSDDRVDNNIGDDSDQDDNDEVEGDLNVLSDSEDDSESGSEEGEPGSDNEEEMDVRLSYDQMMQFPMEWRTTLGWVADECQAMQRRLWDSNPLEKNSQDLSRREWSVLQIREGQQAIWQKISQLATD